MHFVDKIFKRAWCHFLLTDKWSLVLLCTASNSIKHQLFVCAQLNDQTVLFLTIQFITKLNGFKFCNVLLTIQINNSR